MADDLRQTICVDFDGTLTDYHGWVGHQTPADPPLPGAQDFLRKLVEAGHNVWIHTVRDAAEVRQWLGQYAPDIADDITVSNLKPPARIYIDDRGFRFDGNFQTALAALTQLTWWEQREEEATA